MNYCKGVEGMQQSGRKPKKVTYDHYGYFFIAPFFIVFLVFQLYPIFFTFKTSMTDAVGWNKILNNSMVGFKNFQTLFTANETSSLYWLSFKNTVIIWFFNFVPQIGFALILASWFTDQHLHLKAQGANHRYAVLLAVLLSDRAHQYAAAKNRCAEYAV